MENKWVKALDLHDPHGATPDYHAAHMNVDDHEAAASGTLVATKRAPPSQTSPHSALPVFPDHNADSTGDVPSVVLPANLKESSLQQLPSDQPRFAPHSLQGAMTRLFQMEQHMHHTFHQVHKRFGDMQQQHDQDMAALADSLVQVCQRVDSLATDMSTQMQNIATQMQQQTTLIHALMAHVGMEPQTSTSLPAVSQQAFPPTHPQLAPQTVFQFGNRQLRRGGTGSRSPRREGDHLTNNTDEVGLDGIPVLPTDFSFDATGTG